MRLGKKKEKDRDTEKEQSVDGVARMICSPNPKQSHPIPLRGKSNKNWKQNITAMIHLVLSWFLQFTSMEPSGLA